MRTTLTETSVSLRLLTDAPFASVSKKPALVRSDGCALVPMVMPETVWPSPSKLPPNLAIGVHGSSESAISASSRMYRFAGAELAVLGGLSETAQLRLSLDAVGVSLRALAAGEEVARIDRLIAALTGRQQAAVFDLPAVPAVFTHAQQAVHRNAVAQQADGLAGEIRLRIGKLFLRERVGRFVSSTPEVSSADVRPAHSSWSLTE